MAPIQKNFWRDFLMIYGARFCWFSAYNFEKYTPSLSMPHRRLKNMKLGQPFPRSQRACGFASEVVFDGVYTHITLN
ncbi:hypothetical protein, partial [Porphyromonas loveana]|uniref:hypothetical protein n=1 Tax=Porphyromonas loveana TaxID=1884669 RepID=UPI0035A115B6